MIKKIAGAFVVLLITWQANAQIKDATLVAGGLTCSMCSKAIYQALTKMSAVESVKANIKESAYHIVFKQDASVTPDDVKKAVEGAGFSVARLQVTVNFNEVMVKNDAHAALNGLNMHFLNVDEQVLDGDKILTVVDKNFASAKEHKKYARYTTMKCYSTGVMESAAAAMLRTANVFITSLYNVLLRAV